MSWIELDDAILDHPKFIRAVRTGGSGAVHLWLGFRAYCAKNLTDGVIPEDMLDEVRGPKGKEREKALAALLEVGLLEKGDSDAVVMHDFLQWSSSREEVLLRRSVGNSRSALRAKGDIMKSVKDRDDGKCRYCGVIVDWRNHRGQAGGTYDHVVPLSKGGENDVDNIVVACRACNSRKRDRSPAESGMRLLPVTTQVPTGRELVGLPISSPPPLLTIPEEDPPTPLVESIVAPVPANGRRKTDRFMDSFTRLANRDRPDVLELFEDWKLEFGFVEAKLCVGPFSADADTLARNIDAHGLPACKLVLKHAKRDGKVSGRTDENKEKHESIAYIFENQNTFLRILRSAREAEASNRTGGFSSVIDRAKEAG